MIHYLLQINPDVVAPTEMSFGWLLVKTLLALGLILGLAVVFIKYLMPKMAFTLKQSANQKIKITERLPLDARRSLLIVEVEGKRSLIGLSENGFSHVMDLNPKGE